MRSNTLRKNFQSKSTKRRVVKESILKDTIPVFLVENNILDGQSFDETVQNDNLEIILIEKINSKKEDENKTKIKNLPDDLFKKIYNLSSIKSPEIINFNSSAVRLNCWAKRPNGRTIWDCRQGKDILSPLQSDLGFCSSGYKIWSSVPSWTSDSNKLT